MSQDTRDTNETRVSLQQCTEDSPVPIIPEVGTVGVKCSRKGMLSRVSCHRQGHVAAECPDRKPKVVFSRVTNVYKTGTLKAVHGRCSCQSEGLRVFAEERGYHGRSSPFVCPFRFSDHGSELEQGLSSPSVRQTMSRLEQLVIVRFA